MEIGVVYSPPVHFSPGTRRVSRLRSLIFCVVFLSICVHAVISHADKGDEITKDTPGVVYWGDKKSLKFVDFAAYCAPAIWFSPDEPLLDYDSTGYFQLPLPLPFESQGVKGVVYYRLSRVIGVEDAEIKDFWNTEAPHKDDWLLHLDKVSQITLHFFFYYDRESGV